MKVEYTDDQNDNIKFTDANGTEWNTSLSGDGQIPQAARDWIAKGNTPTPYQEPTRAIEEVRAEGIQQMVAFADSITAQILSKYPEAEQRLWSKYEEEARKFDLSNPKSNKIADFPALTGMLNAKYGPANAIEQKARLKAAVPEIIKNADNWLMIAQYVSGLRARIGAQINLANSEDDINTILETARVEAEAVAKQMGLKI